MKRVILTLDIPDDLDADPIRDNTTGGLIQRIGRYLLTEAAEGGDPKTSGALAKMTDSPDAFVHFLPTAFETKVGSWKLEVEDIDRFRHLKRETLYDALGAAIAQTDTAIRDGDVLVLYRSLDDGKVYVRSPGEFYHPDRFVCEEATP